jgi:hypothetical protein
MDSASTMMTGFYSWLNLITVPPSLEDSNTGTIPFPATAR